MDELRESSLLFSLESLLETERQRVEREAREAQERREQELRNVAQLAERRRVAVQQEREARQRREALERERERIEQERIDAMKQATVERARIEAESHARVVEMEQARQHDLALSRIREQQGSVRYRALFWLSAAALAVTLGLALSGFFAFIRPAHAHELSQQKAVARATEQRAVAAERALSAERRASEALEARLAQLQAALEKPKPPGPKAHVGAGKPPRPPVGVKTTSCKDDGDPINGCIR